MPDRPSSASPHTVQPRRELTIAAVIRLIVTESSTMRIRRSIERPAPNPLYISLRTAGIPGTPYPGEIKDGGEMRQSTSPEAATHNYLLESGNQGMACEL